MDGMEDGMDGVNGIDGIKDGMEDEWMERMEWMG